MSRPSPSVPKSGGACRSPRSDASASGLERSASQRSAVANAAWTVAGSGTSPASATPASRIRFAASVVRVNGSGFRGPISTWKYGISGPPGDSTARATRSSSLSASTTSPFGTLRLSSSCGGPQTPSGNERREPARRVDERPAVGAARRSSDQPSSIVGTTGELPIGATPSWRVGARCETRRRPGRRARRRSRHGRRQMSSNSQTTTNGWSAPPSGVAASPARRRRRARRGDRGQRARARRATASSRYLATNGRPVEQRPGASGPSCRTGR